MPLVLLEKECGPKCQSQKHVLGIISLIVKGSLKEFQAYSQLCYNWAKHSDLFGRTALHMAASCGKTEILEWLLENNLVDLNLKDLESGYTALHRALLYGQLTCARTLVQFNADLQVRDVEGLSPLDIAMLDRPPEVTFSVKEASEVYTWGENNNSTLGHPSPHNRTSPEAVDFFKKLGTSIKQIVLCKYHSVFLTQSGQVYTCGHGPGWRLGHGDQLTVLVPRLLESVKEFTCLEIAAATDHTVLRMDKDIVFTFGQNSHYQLGQNPVVDNSPLPNKMNLKPLKGKSVCGVCVGRFHSVVWTADGVFTVGYNAGQMGHPKGEHYVSQLQRVSSLRQTDAEIVTVTCSDAATVCLTTKGDIYILHEYQCRKVVFKGHTVEKLLVTGGNLDHNSGLDKLIEKGGGDLHILLKNKLGQLFMWRSSDPTLRRCQFSLKHQLTVSDFAMATSCLIFSTNRGEAFIGYLSNKKIISPGSKDYESKHSKECVKEFGDGFGQPRLLDQILKEGMEEVQVRRLPVVHRAVMVAADPRGRNFAVLQALANSCMSELPSVTTSEMNEHFGRLLHEADSTDNIHDAIIQVGDRTWPVHKYVVAMRSDTLRNKVTASTAPLREKFVMRVDDVNAEIMEQIISFMYTDMCDYLQPGYKIKQIQPCEKTKISSNLDKPSAKSDAGDIATKGLSAYQVQEKRNTQKSKKKEAIQADVKDKPHQSHNPVRMLQDAARKLGVGGLSKRLESVKWDNDTIVSQGKGLAKPKVKFDQTKLPELYDVIISTESGHKVSCHKCVLVSRLEYFHSMFATGWKETFSTSTLTLPVSGDVLEILVDYLYTDEAPRLRDCTNEEVLCNLLTVSDQLLAWRLKEMCEVALASNISFKNVSELLEFSTVYNADQLKLSCQQFICLNLAAMVEGRYLEVLSQETLDELSAYYRSNIPGMAYRIITPSIDSPSQLYIDDLVAEFENLDLAKHYPDQGSAKKGKQQRKRNKSKKSSTDNVVEKIMEMGAKGAEHVESKIERSLSISSDIGGRSDNNFMAIVEEINRQAEDENKKLTAAIEKNKQKRMHPTDPTSSSLPVSVPTQPRDIPRWTPTYKTLAWPGSNKRTDGAADVVVPESSSPSPMSPSILATSPTSFRDIMQQESESTNKKKITFAGRISWKDVKKQQTKDAKDKQPKSPIQEKEGPPVTNLKAAWGSVGTAVKSFRDVMTEAKDSPTAVTTARSMTAIPAAKATSASSSNPGTPLKSPSSGSASWGYGMPPGRNAPMTCPANTKVSTSPEGENPWQRRAALASSPPSQAPVAALDFSAILRDEKEKSDTLVRTTQKPLALIQLEEKAMAELLAYYTENRGSSDRYITVERVSKQMAAPLWHRGQKPQ